MAVLARIIEIMRLRAGPQEMPGDQATLGVAIGCYVLMGIVQLLILDVALQAVILALLTALLLGIYTAALLLWRGVPNRFRQTATALFATGTVFSVIMLGPNLALAPYLKAMRSNPGAQPPVSQTAGQTVGQTVGQTAGRNNAPQQTANTASTQSANGPATGRSSSSATGRTRIPTSVFWGFMLFAIIGIWRLVVFSHIYREALDTTRWMGFAAAIGYEVFLLIVIQIV